MPIGGALNTFRIEVATFNGYITRAFTQNTSGAYVLSSSERAFIVDSAFLRMFIAWEVFLEEVFVRYLLGHTSTAGKGAQRLALPPNDQHAIELLIGTQKYVDWANPEIVRKLAKLVFINGDPILPIIGSIQTDLFDLKTVRNGAAHLTSTTSKQLDALASRKLGGARVNIAVSDFLSSVDPGSASGATILAGYLALLDAAADNIANWA